ncbi:hypothetical protein IWW36_000068 [Coemansia brasiliensis]|uniref:G protein-coupled receptor n=1 Tax=Coemansia brasiliensis TaxID=2650707 RepID=A0A9W8IBL1_9FUNG|nr:hypothetical protein IWW36_000068 [Coemansia brasiliensis]
MSVFVRALLSVHLQLLILSNVTRALTYEKHFLIGALGVSLVLSILPIFTKNYVWLSFDPTMSSAHCGYFPLHRTTNNVDIPSEFLWTENMAQSAMRKGLIMMWTTNFAWLTLTVFYGIIVIASVVIRMIHRRSTVKNIAKSQNIIIGGSLPRREFVYMTTRVIRRILQFPLMVVVCHLLEVVYGMVTLSRAIHLMRSGLLSTNDIRDFESGRTLTRLYLASHIMLGLEGVITLCFLPLEPPIRLMLRSMYLRQRSELHRLSTVSRANRRQNLPKQNDNLTSEDSFTLSSFDRPSDSLEPMPDKPLAPEPSPMVQQPAASPVIPDAAVSPVLSVVVDHYITPAQRAREQNTQLVSAPIRRVTQRWKRRTQKQKVDRPPPVYRSKTVQELPWDIVSVPRRRSCTGSVVMQPEIPGDATNPAQALRNDGLPLLQWYVPSVSSDSTNDTDKQPDGGSNI